MTDHDPNPYSPAKGRFHLCCLLATWSLVALTLRSAVVAAHDPRGAALLVMGALGGLLLADLASGVVHWLCDTYGSPDTPIVGRLFIQLFRVHHVDPDNITRAGFVRINGDNSMVAGAFLGGVLLVRGLAPDAPGTLAMLATFTLGIAFTNLFHQWAHHPSPPRVARWLQARALVLTPAAHARHHRAPFRSDYCITFGWLNPVIDRIRLFRALEALLPFRRASDDVPGGDAAR